MKIFIEGIERNKENPKVIRVEVKPTVTEITAVASIDAKLKGLRYKVIRHKCFHDELEPCVTELIKEI